MIHLSIEERAGGIVQTTIDFNLGGYQVLDGYYPTSGDGSKQLTEDFDVSINGTSANDLIGKVRTIERILNFAEQHPDGPDGAWILYSPDDGLTPWQSRLSGGTLIQNSKITNRWKEFKVKLQVAIERAPFWETEDLITLQVTNRTGTGPSAALVNHQDGGATGDLYLEIAADQVTGVLPTPVVIEIENTTNDANLVDHLIVGHFAASGTNATPAAGDLVFEGTGTADAGCSGGSYASLSWTDAAETQLTTWTLASGSFRQRNYKAVARLQADTEYTDLYVKVKLLMGSIILAETRWSLVEAGQELIEIGSMQIPPFRFGAHVDLGNLTLALYSKRAGGAGSLALDYLVTLPQDSWRKLEAVTGLAYGETLIDDPTDGRLVTLSGSAYTVTHVLAEGEEILLQPGVKNVLYFLHDLTTGGAPIARISTVVVKIRPRRLTV